MDNQEVLYERLERDLLTSTDVHIPPDVDKHAYLADLAADIRRSRCKPHALSALVMPPGLPGRSIGDVVTGVCVASRAGYWLVYDEGRDVFLAFWGEDPHGLGAHGVYGSALYCWSA